jgi:Rhodanese-like domain
MKMVNWRTVVIGAIVLSFACTAGLLFYANAGAAEASKKSIDELKAALGKPDVSIVDVRLESSFAKSDKKIKGAARENPDATGSWAKKYPKDKMIVLYCS